jgi:hypothetical protein
VRGLSPNYSCSDVSVQSTDPIHTQDSWDEDEGDQDIQEVWFPGCHAVSNRCHYTHSTHTHAGYRRRLASRCKSRCSTKSRTISMDGS